MANQDAYAALCTRVAQKLIWGGEDSGELAAAWLAVDGHPQWRLFDLDLLAKGFRADSDLKTLQRMLEHMNRTADAATTF